MTKPNLSLRGTLVAALAALASPLATAQFDVGLVAYWPLDGDTLDATATGAHGTFVPGTGDPTERYELAKFGDGIFLNDIVSGAFDQYIEIDGVPEGTFDFAGGSMTVSAWVASPVLTLASQSIVSKGIADTWSLARDGDTSLAPAMTGGLGTTSAAGDPLNPDHFLHPDVPTNDNSVLVHVVGVVEAGIGIRVYVNGQLAGSANGNAQLGNSAFNLWIGANPEADPILELSRTWEGLIDDVAVWSRALSAGEIATIYNNGTGVSIADILNPVDTDGDGMPDFYENTNGLDPNVDDAGGDLDGDGRTNIQEFQDGTNPDNSDTDGDGLSDGEEATAGTNPNATDTDGDRLSDGEEINGTLNPFLGGVLRDPFDPLSDPAGDPTNPLETDTDNDSFDDKTEIDFQADPNDIADQPSRWQIGLKGYWQLHLDDWTNSDPDPALRTFEDASGRGFPGVLSGANTTTLNSFAGPFGETVVRFDGVDQRIEITGDPDEFAMAGGDLTVSTWFLTPGWGKSWQAVVAKGEGNNWRMHRHGAEATGALAYAGGRADIFGGPNLADFAWHHAVAISKNGVGTELYVDGELVASGPDSNLTANGKAMMIGGNPDAAGGGHRSLFGAVTEVAVWDRPLSASEIKTMYNNGAGATLEDLIIGIDTDGDGMIDIYEDTNGLDKNDPSDAGGDLDNDGLTNLQEHNNGTPPNDPDPDGDGLNDGDEFAAGTDPFKADTDGDGLGDGDEVTGARNAYLNGSLRNGFDPASDPPGDPTDPLNSDSDHDGSDDGSETVAKTDPNDPNSTPPFPVVLAYYPFDDEELSTADLGPNGWNGTVNGANSAFVEGHTGLPGDFAIDFDGSSSSVTTGVNMLGGLSEYTMSGWAKFEVAQAGRTGLWGQNDAVEFGMINSTTLHYWIPGSGAINVTLGPSSNGWRHIAVVTTPTGRSTYVDGVEAVSGGTTVPVPVNAFTFNIGGSGVFDGANNWFNGQIDDVAVWDVALTAGEIQALANSTVNPLGQPIAGPAGVVLTLVEFNGAAFEVTAAGLDPGASYILRRTTDGETFLDIGAALTGADALTFADPAPPAGTALYQIWSAP